MQDKESRLSQTGILIGLNFDALHYVLILLVGRFPSLYYPFGYFTYHILESISLNNIQILPPVIAYNFTFAIYGILIGFVFDVFKFKISEKQEIINKILIWILIALGIIAAGLHYWAKVDIEKLYPQEASTRQQASEVANWKTYTNSEYGFEFKYPPELSVKEMGREPEDSEPESLLIKISIYDAGYKAPTDAVGQEVRYGLKDVDFRIYKNSEGIMDYEQRSLGAAINESKSYEYGDYRPFQKYTISVGNSDINAYKLESGLVGPYFETGFTHDKYLFGVFSYQIDLAKQILSTLRFKDGAISSSIVPKDDSSVSNWKTYSNETYNFLFNYPDDIILESETSSYPFCDPKINEDIHSFFGLHMKEKWSVTFTQCNFPFDAPGTTYGGYSTVYIFTQDIWDKLIGLKTNLKKLDEKHGLIAAVTALGSSSGYDCVDTPGELCMAGYKIDGAIEKTFKFR